MYRGNIKHTEVEEDIEASGIVVAVTSKTPAQPQIMVSVYHKRGSFKPNRTQVVSGLKNLGSAKYIAVATRRFRSFSLR